MLTRARPAKAKAARDLAAERLDRTFTDTLTKIEDLARKRILRARDPFGQASCWQGISAR